MQGDLAERDVADDQVEVVAWDSGVGEGLGPDVGARVEVLGDRRGARVELDTAQRAVLRGHDLGGQPDEGAGAAAGLEHAHRLPVGAKPAVDDQVPHRLRQGGVGVVGVEGRLGCGAPFPLVEQLLEFAPFAGELAIGLVEDLRHRAPPRPAGQHRLFLRGRRPVLLLQLAQRRQRGQVRGHFRSRASRCEVLLRSGTKR